MKKVLFVAHVESHILHFHIPYLKLFHDKGYEVHVATNGDSKIPFCDVKYNLPFQKSPLKKENYIAFKEMKKILDTEVFEIIHCHTPVGGVIARLANRISKNYNNTRMIYTAHGFHFYNGAPLSYWLIFYPIERWMAHYTDVLITMNQEDYQRGKKFKLRNNGKTEYVHGVGVDETKFKFSMNDSEKIKLRSELGLESDDYVMIFPAELSKRKNQIFLIDVMKKLSTENKKIKLLLPGKDLLNGELQRIVKKHNLAESILFLGYRNDIPKLLKISDILISSSLQEGLPVNLVEASLAGMKCIVKNSRGNRELGYTFESESELYNLLKNSNDLNVKNVDQYLLKNVIQEYVKIYWRDKITCNP